MSETIRKAIVLAFRRGQSSYEIARRFDVSLDAVRIIRTGIRYSSVEVAS